MSVEVELFRSDDYVQAGKVSIAPLLRIVFEPLVGGSLAGALFHLAFLRLADRRPLEGSPTMVNLRSGHGYVKVQIVRDGEVIYQHPHSVREIVAAPLQRLLAEQIPDETHWGYGVNGPGLEHVALVRPAPRPQHEVELGSTGQRRRLFEVQEVAQPAAPTATLAEIGVSDERVGVRAPTTVVLRESALEDLATEGGFSDEVEEGGFLVGHVYRDADAPECHLLEVTAGVRAERTGASLLQFTFTGESFLRMSEQLVRRNLGEQLVGWYHTHLFPATSALGLSSIDVELHRSTFRRPWQVAGLINLASSGSVLRFYRSEPDDSGMVLAPYWVAGGAEKPRQRNALGTGGGER